METITRTLFEEPFWFLVGLGLLEVVLVAMWHGRRTKGLARALAVPIAVGIVVILTAALVETDRERLVATMERMTADLEMGRIDVLTETLDEKVLVNLGEYGGRGLDKAQTVTAAERSIKQYAVSRIRLSNVVTEMSDRPVMDVTTIIFSDAPGFSGRPAPLRWRMHWIQREGQWRILEIEKPTMTLGK